MRFTLGQLMYTITLVSVGLATFGLGYTHGWNECLKIDSTPAIASSPWVDPNPYRDTPPKAPNITEDRD